MSHPEIVRATPAVRERVVETVVAAFVADPAFRYFFPDEASYRDQAAAFTGHLFDPRVARGTVWVIYEGAAVAMWDGPRPDAGGNPDDTASLSLPAETIARLDRYDAVVDAALRSTPHWYLGILATHPDHSGRGWGRAVMTAGLDEAAASGLPAYLETTNPRNVELYRRAGWEVTEPLTVDGLQIWIMRYAGPNSRRPANS